MRHELAVVIVTACRTSLLRAVRSLYGQAFCGHLQILVGVDHDPQGRGSLLRNTLAAECPRFVTLTWIDLGYSTSRRHGGPHDCFYGGSMRSALTLLADAEIVMYLDDDDWLAADHCSSVMEKIPGNKWAFAYSIYADGNTGEGLCDDETESVGPDKGIYAREFGGFVRPSGLAINKLQLLNITHLWACSPSPSGDSEDRLIFEQLRREPYGCTGQATVFYAIDPKDRMHGYRVSLMQSKGIAFKSDNKMGSLR